MLAIYTDQLFFPTLWFRSLFIILLFTIFYH